MQLLPSWQQLGGGSANAAVETIDFATFTAGLSNTPSPALDLNSSIEQAGTNAKTVYVATNPTNGDKTLDLKGRIALDNSSANQMRWIYRTSSNAYQNGLAGNWNSKGTAVTSYNISILNLYAGDKITITYAIQSGKTAQLHACSADIVAANGTNLAAEAIVASGTQYTMNADGHFDMYCTNNNMAISKIEIESSHVAESVEAPGVALTGVNNGDRIVTITGKNTNTDSATKTYYTLDGTEPTNTSTEYTAPITITEAQATNGAVTVKAITYKDGSTDIKSTVAELALTDVGTTISLNAPTSYVKNFQLTGNIYNKVFAFTSDQSSVLLKPVATLTYTIDGGESAAAADFVADKAATIVVTASATGYGSTSATFNITKEEFIRNFYYDFSTLPAPADLETGKVGTQNNVGGAGCQSYELASDAVDGLTINMNLLWAISAKKVRGLYARVNNGSVTYNGTMPEGTNISYTTEAADPTISTTATTSFAKYTWVKDIAVYSPMPATLPVAVTAAGLATFSPVVGVDFTSNTDVAAYKAMASGEKVVLTKVNKVAAGEGVVVRSLNGNAVAANVAVDATATANEGNQLVGVQTAIASLASEAEGKKNYILNTIDGNTAFYAANGKAVAAGRAYLQLDATNAAKSLTISFDDEADGIAEISTEAKSADAAIYNLRGQRVANPAKGLYIQNGKKVIIK